MNSKQILILTLVSLLFANCDNDKETLSSDLQEDEFSLDQMDSQEIDAFKAHFKYMVSLELGWSRDRVTSELPDKYTVFVDDENYLSFEYKAELFSIIATFGFDEELNNTDYTVSVEVEKEELMSLLFEYIKEKITQHWLSEISTSSIEEYYANWEINKDGTNFIVHLSVNENHLNLNALVNDTVFRDEKEDGEWVQVGEDGRWIFVPNN